MQMIREASLADAMAIAKVQVDSWQSTYAGIVPGTIWTPFRMNSEPQSGATFSPPQQTDNSSMLPKTIGGMLLASRRAAK